VSCSEQENPVEVLRKQVGVLQQDLARSKDQIDRQNVQIGQLEERAKNYQSTIKPLEAQKNTLEKEKSELQQENQDLKKSVTATSNYITERKTILAEMDRLRVVEKEKRELELVQKKYEQLLSTTSQDAMAAVASKRETFSEEEIRQFAGATLELSIPKAGSSEAKLTFAYKFLDPFSLIFLSAGSAKLEPSSVSVDLAKGLATVYFPNAKEFEMAMRVSNIEECVLTIGKNQDKLSAVFKRLPKEEGWVFTKVPFALTSLHFKGIRISEESGRWVAKR
jgi:hypothetical protein